MAKLEQWPYKFAASVQEGFAKEEFLAAMKGLYENMLQDFSEDDLAKIAGGSIQIDTNNMNTSFTSEPDILQQMNIDWSKIMRF